MLIGKNALRHYVGGTRMLACNSKCALCEDMSEQYISLDPTARSRYLAKLQVLMEVDDPLALWNDKCLYPVLSTCTSFALRPVNSTTCILRAIVNPSHRSSDNPYWVERRTDSSMQLVLSTGQISTVHTCPFSK